MATEFLDVIEQTIVQALEPGIKESLDETDDVWPRILQTAVGVRREPKGMGRDFIFQKVYRTGVGGGMFWGQVGGGTLLTTEAGTPTGARILDSPRTYPAHNESTTPEFVTVQGQLVKARGNIILDETVLLANELDASIGDVIALKITDAAGKFSDSLTKHFYALPTQGSGTDIDGVLAVVGTTHTDPDDSGNASVNGDSAVTINLSKGQLAQFRPGDQVELFDTVGTTRRHAASATLRAAGDSFLVVDVVDQGAGTLVCRLHGGSTFTSEVATGDLLILQRDPTAPQADIRNTSTDGKSRGPYGLNDWIKSSGTLFDENGETGIDLALYPTFKSITSTLTTILTETDLNTLFGRFWTFHGNTVKLDTIITTMGVLNGYVSGQDGQFTWERNNTTLKNKAGWTTFTYILNGREFDFLISRGLEAGVMVALQLGNNNVEMLLPPAAGEMFGSDSRFGPLIEFVNKPNIFKMYHSSSLSSEYREAPFRSYLNIMPIKPQSIRISGITEVI